MKYFHQSLFVTAFFLGNVALAKPAPSLRIKENVIFQKKYIPMKCAYQGDVGVQIKAEACQLHIGKRIGANYTREYYQWRGRNGHLYTFVGQHNPADVWWFGILNGKRAVGYQINREHYVFSSEDLSIQFEAWIEGYQHGNY